MILACFHEKAISVDQRHKASSVIYIYNGITSKNVMWQTAVYSKYPSLANRTVSNPFQDCFDVYSSISLGLQLKQIDTVPAISSVCYHTMLLKSSVFPGKCLLQDGRICREKANTDQCISVTLFLRILREFGTCLCFRPIMVIRQTICNVLKPRQV